MTRLLAIDPGNEQSAVVVYDTATRLPVWWAKEPNEQIRGWLDETTADLMAIEMVASYGMAVGATVFETCVWAGRFIERWMVDLGSRRGRDHAPVRVYRRDVKLHLCGSPRAKDANIRQALIDRYGPSKARAVGLKASPGPLYGIKADCWSALAVAITAVEANVREATAA
jgi:hypothetical protein